MSRIQIYYGVLVDKNVEIDLKYLVSSEGIVHDNDLLTDFGMVYIKRLAHHTQDNEVGSYLYELSSTDSYPKVRFREVFGLKQLMRKQPEIIKSNIGFHAIEFNNVNMHYLDEVLSDIHL